MVGLGAAALAMSAARPAEASGGCIDVGCTVGWLSYVSYVPLILLAGAGVVVGVGADVYYTPGILAHAHEGDAPSATTALHEIYWTSWQSVIYLGVAGAVATSDLDGGATALMFSVWPVGITAHGIWYSSKDPLARYPVPIVLGLSDAALLAYDTSAIVRKQPVGPAYAVVEILAGGLQTDFAIGIASNQHGGDRARTLALGAMPALMTLHGLGYLIVGPPKTETAPPPESSKLTWTPFVVPRADGADVMVRGVW
jgi:hypothetical protein